MKYLAVVIIAAIFAVGLFTNYADSHASQKTCVSGVAKGYAASEDYPNYLPGTIPNTYTDSPGFFSVRYNCKSRSVHIKRVGLGVYDVKFPGLKLKAAIITVQNDDGGFASTTQISANEFRVIIRGPLSQTGVNLLRDLAFYIVVY